MMDVYYDLKHCPPTFDFVTFLLRVAALGHDAVNLHILPGPVGGFRDDNLWPYSVAERGALLENIVVPMAHMLPCVKSVAVHRDRPSVSGFGVDEYSMHGRYLFALLGAGVRPLRPLKVLPKFDNLVTFTLREAEHWPERNSNVPEWMRAAAILRERGLTVRIIRDTRHEPLSLEDRGALYRSAACNALVSNGPMAFSLACDAPTLVMRPTCDALGGCFGREFFRECGVNLDGQIPGLPAYQRFVWKNDTAENIVAAVTEFLQ